MAKLKVKPTRVKSNKQKTLKRNTPAIKRAATKKSCSTRLEKWIITAVNDVAKENDTTAVAFVRDAIVPLCQDSCPVS